MGAEFFTGIIFCDTHRLPTWHNFWPAGNNPNLDPWPFEPKINSLQQTVEYYNCAKFQVIPIRGFRVLSLWRFAAEIAAIRRLHVGLRVRYKYYIKKQLFWFGLEPPAHRSRSISAHKCIPYNNRCVQNFIQIGWDLAVRGPEKLFWSKNRERPSLCLAVNKCIV